jgi:phosphatidylglycerol:prolipoprotein diacylglycerol transferase
MHRTLFFIPHSLAGIPIVGFGWALGLLAVAFGIWLWLVKSDPQKSLKTEIQQTGFFWLGAAVVIAFVLPRIEIQSVASEPVGIAVRGYGVFLLCGVASGVALALYRAKNARVSPDTIFNLAFWLLIGGIVGARTFYVVEYWDDFVSNDVKATLFRVLDFTRGGLVVYGSILGGALATVAFCYRYRQSAFQIGDIIIPSLFLGIFFGRLGCLMNGCCYAGRCEDSAWATYFPPGSPVYMEQMESGELLGLTLAPIADDPAASVASETTDDVTTIPWVVSQVAAGSPAALRGIKVGDTIDRIYPRPPSPDRMDPHTPIDDSSTLDWVAVVNRTPLLWTADELPPHAMAVRSAQLVSSINGLWICITLLLISRFGRLRTGTLAAIGFIVYALVRFVEEIIRSDEPGQFGTDLTIAQWVSLAIIPAALAVILFIYKSRAAELPTTLNANSGTGLPR